VFTLATKFLPTPALFAQAVEAGFPGAELWLDAAVLANWRTVAEQARPHPLRYGLHFPNRIEQSAETLDHTVSLYRALNSRSLVIHQPHMDRHGAALLQREPELRLAVENHRLTPDQLLTWATRNPGLALDVEHLWMCTWPDAPLARLLAEVRAFLGVWAGKLRHVHLPGYLPGQEEHRPMYCSRDLVFGIWEILNSVGYRDLVVSEVAQEFQNPFDLRMDVLLFEGWQQRKRDTES
jgi:hypothetical protein